MTLVRLHKFLSDCGVCSRRAAEKHIVQGDVAVNEKIITELGTKIDPTHDKVFFNKSRVTPRAKNVYLMLNKPVGYICTCSSIHKEKTILELLPHINHLYPVGRLDKDSEGLLLVTTDGEFAHHIMHPRFKQEKEYHVICLGTVTPEIIAEMKQGIRLKNEDGTTEIARIKDAVITRREPNKSYLAITLDEGKKRQIRRMLQHYKFRVQYLKRLGVGKLRLGTLATGAWRHLTAREVSMLMHGAPTATGKPTATTKTGAASAPRNTTKKPTTTHRA